MPAVLRQLGRARLSVGQLFQKRDNLPKFSADEIDASRPCRILVQLAVMPMDQLVDEHHFFAIPLRSWIGLPESLEERPHAAGDS